MKGNYALNQWLRRWTISPTRGLVCSCGYFIPSAPKGKWWTKKRRYNWYHRRQLAHYKVCPKR